MNITKTLLAGAGLAVAGYAAYKGVQYIRENSYPPLPGDELDDERNNTSGLRDIIEQAQAEAAARIDGVLADVSARIEAGEEAAMQATQQESGDLPGAIPHAVV